jgi:hypothetical protein
MNKKWANHSQPPTFYWTFKNVVQNLHSMDYRLRSSRFSTKSRIELPGEEKIDVTDLLANPHQAAALLSRVCMMIFEGKLMVDPPRAGKAISAAIVRKLGDKQMGELIDTRGSQETGSV